MRNNTESSQESATYAHFGGNGEVYLMSAGDSKGVWQKPAAFKRILERLHPERDTLLYSFDDNSYDFAQNLLSFVDSLRIDSMVVAKHPGVHHETELLDESKLHLSDVDSYGLGIYVEEADKLAQNMPEESAERSKIENQREKALKLHERIKRYETRLKSRYAVAEGKGRDAQKKSN